MEILYTDARIVVCLKPAGVLSADEPGGMPELLRGALGLGADGCIRVVHRLDQPVGGVMVYARSRAADSILSRQVQAHEFEKEYLAVLEGVLQPEAGTLEDYLRRDAKQHKTYPAPAPGKDARPARLSYRVLGVHDGLTLVRVRLYTGRTHQIRAQFACRGLPLSGDRKYGASREGAIGLWSYRIAFFHPQTNERLCFLHRPPDEDVWRIFSRELAQEEA